MAHPLGTVADVRVNVKLDDLDASQRAAVASPHVPLAIIAPAGSGKTRVLTRRIAHRIQIGAAETRHVLALTFTRKAAGELIHRLAQLGVERTVTAGTFHAIALAQLRHQATERGYEPPRILDRKARILGPILGGRGPRASLVVTEIAAEIEWAKARRVTPDDYVSAATREMRRLPRPAGEIAEHYHAYEMQRRKRRVLDFDDVLDQCTRAIEREDEFAAAQRWRFRHLFVDEFQDATPLQLALLHAWLGDRHDLTVVGDPAQSIYGFAGADASPLLAFDREFAGAQTVALTRNYRSTPAVVALAEVALGPNARAAPIAVRAPGAAPTIRAYDDDEAEAAAVVAQCWRAYAAGVSWHHMAVLFRTNAQSSLFEAACARRNVPFRVADGQRFVGRPAVRALLDRLRELEREDAHRPLAQHLADLTTDDTVLESEEMSAHLDALTELGRDYMASEGAGASVAGFASWLDTATQSSNSSDGIDLLTFHRAKGLEWPLVFVTGLERGFVPIAWAQSDGAHAEEQRLLHVALSRAQDELSCSWARARTVGTRRVEREPSPWLLALETTAREYVNRPVGHATRVAEMRETLAAAAPPTPRRAQVR